MKGHCAVLRAGGSLHNCPTQMLKVYFRSPPFPCISGLESFTKERRTISWILDVSAILVIPTQKWLENGTISLEKNLAFSLCQARIWNLEILLLQLGKALGSESLKVAKWKCIWNHSESLHIVAKFKFSNSLSEWQNGLSWPFKA